MQRVDFDTVAKWSPWPARLLGLSEWNIPQRTLIKVVTEYDNDKYWRCLELWRQRGNDATIQQIRDSELGLDPQGTVCFSRDGQLYSGSAREAIDHFNERVLDYMQQAVAFAGTIVDLGCGYGYLGHALTRRFGDIRYLGGEYSENAVTLAASVHRDHPNIRVKRFNFYDAASYEMLAAAIPPLVVVTSHAIEQLPSAVPFLENLQPYADAIESVIHIEPAVQHDDDSLLGLMRRRYAQINDYNRDLLPELRKRPNIRIAAEEFDILGLPPFNPSAIIRWEFRHA